MFREELGVRRREDRGQGKTMGEERRGRTGLPGSRQGQEGAPIRRRSRNQADPTNIGAGRREGAGYVS